MINLTMQKIASLWFEVDDRTVGQRNVITLVIMITIIVQEHNTFLLSLKKDTVCVI